MPNPRFKIAATDKTTGQTVYGSRRFGAGKLAFRHGIGIQSTRERDVGLHTSPAQGEALDISDAAVLLCELNAELALTGSSWLTDPRIVQA